MTYPMTQSLCPECLQLIPAEIIHKKGQILMKKECNKHGLFEEVYWPDSDLYDDFSSFQIQGVGIHNPYQGSDFSNVDCPNNCGLCSVHQTYTSMGLIDVTNRCNLRCPICFANANVKGWVYEPTMDQILKMMRLMRDQKPVSVNSIMFAGGEPTVREDIFEIAEYSLKMGFGGRLLATNGVKLAKSLSFTKELKEYQQKNKEAFRRDLDLKRRFGKGDDIKRDSRAPGAKTPVEKMNMIVEREKKAKEEFFRQIEDIEFKLGETFLDDNTRVFVHEATYKQKRLVIISYALEGEIDNVSLLFESASGKQGEEFFFDLGELQALEDAVIPTFIKSKLGLFSKMLGVSRTLEAIWFLGNTLTVERKLPIKTVEFIQDTFLGFLEDIETDIHKKTVQDALKT